MFDYSNYPFSINFHYFYHCLCQIHLESIHFYFDFTILLQFNQFNVQVQAQVSLKTGHLRVYFHVKYINLLENGWGWSID
jgi:hypothetical protein